MELSNHENKRRHKNFSFNLAKLLQMRETGLKNDKVADFQMDRLRCFKYLIVSRLERSFREKVHHPNLYAKRTFTCKFSDCPGAETILAHSCADGWLSVLNSTGDSSHGKEHFSEQRVEHNSIVDFAWMPNDLKLISGSVDGKLTIWNINSPYSLPGKDFVGHKRAVRTVCFSNYRRGLFGSGGQDGEIFLYDYRSSAKSIFSILNAHTETDDKLYNISEDLFYQEAKSVTGLAFQDENTLFSCSFGKRIIKAWDLRHLKEKFVDEPEYKYSLLLYPEKSNQFNGFTCLSVDPAGRTLYARCTNESIYSYDLSTTDLYFPVAEYKTGNKAKSNYMDSIFTKASLSPDGTHLISSSNSDTAYIWRTDSPGKPKAEIVAPGDVIKSVAWSRASETKIATHTMNNYIGLWQDEVEVAKRKQN